jgi:hypothetical protein
MAQKDILYQDFKQKYIYLKFKNYLRVQKQVLSQLIKLDFLHFLKLKTKN